MFYAMLMPVMPTIVIIRKMSYAMFMLVMPTIVIMMLTARVRIESVYSNELRQRTSLVQLLI